MRVTEISITNIYFLAIHYTIKLRKMLSAKYLGITITDNIDRGQYISEISSKATIRHLVSVAGTWLLRQGVLSHCSKQVRLG